MVIIKGWECRRTGEFEREVVFFNKTQRTFDEMLQPLYLAGSSPHTDHADALCHCLCEGPPHAQ